MRSFLIVIGLGVFVLVLLYITVRSTSTPLTLSSEDRKAAQSVCHTSVRDRLPDARFPFDPNFEDQGSGRLRLSGSVDSGPDGQPVRRNYECLVANHQSGAYVADSVAIYQTH